LEIRILGTEGTRNAPGVGRALHYDWLLDHSFALVPAQAYVGRFLATFKDYPPRQKAASFSIDQALEKLKQPSGD
jgi:arylsulfatase